MKFATIGFAAAIALSTSGLAFAQQAGQLDDLDADRISDTQIEIEFEFDGGACDEVGTAQVGDVVDGTLSVTFPVTTTGEVCTQQIVEIEVEQTVAAEHIISQVDVTVTGADGATVATGSTDVESD